MLFLGGGNQTWKLTLDVKRFLIKKQASSKKILKSTGLTAAWVALGSGAFIEAAPVPPKARGAAKAAKTKTLRPQGPQARNSEVESFGTSQEIVIGETPVQDFGAGLDIPLEEKASKKKETIKKTAQAKSHSATQEVKKTNEASAKPKIEKKANTLQRYLKTSQQDQARSEPGPIQRKAEPSPNEAATAQAPKKNALEDYLNQSKTKDQPTPAPRKGGSWLQALRSAEKGNTPSAAAPKTEKTEAPQPRILEAYFEKQTPVHKVKPLQTEASSKRQGFKESSSKPQMRTVPQKETLRHTRETLPGGARVVQAVASLEAKDKPRVQKVATPLPQLFFLDMAPPTREIVSRPPGAMADRGPKRPVPQVPSRSSIAKDSSNAASANQGGTSQLASKATKTAKALTRGLPSDALTSKVNQVTGQQAKPTLKPSVVVVTPITEASEKAKATSLTEATKLLVVEEGKNAQTSSTEPPSQAIPAILEKGTNAFTLLTSSSAQETPPQDADTTVRQTEAYKALPATVIETKSSPTLTFSGDLCTFLGTVSQDDARDDHEGTPHLSMGWGNFGLNISGEVNESIQYGYHGTLEIVPGSSIGMKDNYGEVTTPLGVVQFGNVSGVESAFLDDSSCLSNGTGGPDGSYGDLFNKPAGLPNMNYLMGYTKKATKLVYYSPRWQGFQLGVSYCPNPHHVGWGSLGDQSYADTNGNDDGVFHNGDMKKRHNLAIGMNYQQDFSNLSINASVVGLREKTKIKIDVPQLMHAEYKKGAYIEYTVPREVQLKSNIAYQASGSIAYRGLKLTGAWMNNGSLNLPNTDYDAERLGMPGMALGDCGRGWNIGGEYSFGCMAISLAHNEIHREVTPYEKAFGKLNVLGVEAQVISGVKLFAEVMHVNAETTPKIAALYDNSAPTKNKGTIVMIGSKVSF